MRRIVTLALAALALCGVSPPAGNERSAAEPCSNAKLPVAILNGPAPNQHAPSLALVTVQAPAKSLTLAVAASEADRELGLMCVTALAPQHGMIFVFATSSEQEFWMKRTLVPLDMVWLDASGRVTHVAAGVPASTLDTPDDAVARRSGQGRYVVELRAGEAAIDGIRTGALLRFAALRAEN